MPFLVFSGGFWHYASKCNINKAGFIIVGIFVVTWVAALSIWRSGKVEARWDQSASLAGAERANEPSQV